MVDKTSNANQNRRRKQKTPSENGEAGNNVNFSSGSPKKHARERQSVTLRKGASQQVEPRFQPTRQALIGEFFSLIVGTTSDAISWTFFILRKPTVFLIVLYLLFQIILSLMPSMHAIFLPICTTPIVSGLLPFCPSITSRTRPDYPNLVKLQSHFENVLELSGGSNALALDIRGSESAIRDLSTLVRVSELVAKDELVDKLETFVVDSKEAARGLQRLGSRVGGAVDNILSMDEYVLRTLEKIAGPEELGIGAPSFGFIDYINPFSASRAQVHQRQALADSFNSASELMSKQLKGLITEAHVSDVLLSRLEVDMDTLHVMIERERKTLVKDHKAVRADLWTILGGNRDKIDLFEENASLLLKMSSYRTAARNRVAATIGELQQLSEDLEELRTRVATPALVGADAAIPLEVHVDSIKKGVERLGQFRKRGVEKENEQLRRIISGTSGGDNNYPRLPRGST